MPARGVRIGVPVAVEVEPGAEGGQPQRPRRRPARAGSGWLSLPSQVSASGAPACGGRPRRATCGTAALSCCGARLERSASPGMRSRSRAQTARTTRCGLLRSSTPTCRRRSRAAATPRRRVPQLDPVLGRPRRRPVRRRAPSRLGRWARSRGGTAPRSPSPAARGHGCSFRRVLIRTAVRTMTAGVHEPRRGARARRGGRRRRPPRRASRAPCAHPSRCVPCR